MAFDFIKKVFTFGRKAEEEQAPPASPAPSDQPALAPYIGISEQPAVEAPAVEAVEPAPVPETPLQSLPEVEVLPPIREPEPVSADALRAEVAPEPSALPTPEARAAEPPVRTAQTEEPAPAPPAVKEAAPEPAAALPVEEILPPIRVPDPVHGDPLIEELAPEPATPLPEPSQPPAAEIAPEPVQPTPRPAAEPVPSPPPTPAPAPAGKVTVTKKVEAKAEPVAPAAPAPRASWFQRMREGLARSSRELSSSIAGVFTKKKLDEDTLQDLEEVLIRADLGVETALRITDTLSATRLGRDVSDTEVRTVMAQEIEKVLKPVALPLELDLSHKPHVILVVGVNGTGKTTTIGKLAAKLTAGGLKVMLAAGDTFRAAAIEQLKIWGERTNSPVIATKLGADAAGLAYDAFARAKEAGSDVLIIDTAGRLQNSAELMAELEKIVRVLGRLDPEAPHTVLQTVDATTGQNALNQVEIFRNVAGVNGLVMTKLDGTARGGILVAIAAKHKLPVYFIGVGEQVDDLEPFSANEFARAIAGV
nr:signal recognition particle-docking protein FtsY [Mesorhizobium sp.]